MLVVEKNFRSRWRTSIKSRRPGIRLVMRSNQGYYTRSHQNSEVKRLWAGIVLGWVTSREVPVLHPDSRLPSFFFFSLHDSSSRTQNQTLDTRLLFSSFTIPHPARSQDQTLDTRPALWSGDSRLAPGSRGSGLAPRTPPLAPGLERPHSRPGLPSPASAPDSPRKARAGGRTEQRKTRQNERNKQTNGAPAK